MFFLTGNYYQTQLSIHIKPVMSQVYVLLTKIYNNLFTPIKYLRLNISVDWQLIESNNLFLRQSV